METTVFNYYFEDDPDREQDKLDTVELFEEISGGRFEWYYSDVVQAEIGGCPEPKRTKMLNLIKRYNIQPVSNYQGYDDLGALYMSEGIIPFKKRNDALHIALATVSKQDVLVSWNCSHIVKFRTIKVINAINSREGYQWLHINTPREVIEVDRSSEGS